MRSDNELRKILDISLQGNMIILRYLGDSTDEEDLRMAEIGYKEIIKKIQEKRVKKIKILIDLTRINKRSTLTCEAKRKYSEMLRKLTVEKIAILGGGLIIRIIAFFIVKLSKISYNFRLFKTEEKALGWLRN